jgi:hypothetical protein
MKIETRFKLIRAAIWVLSVFSLVGGLVFIREPSVSPFSQTYASLMVEVGGAFFFAWLWGGH